jgi:4-amino-4-deoxy-L-arabinose transferase-like glycosyltransferase
METLLQKIKANWQIVAIVVLATVLRVWQLDTLGIFFGDAGHDILSAIEAVEKKSIPLLGIESSVPRFKQGPVTVWLHMLLLVLPGKSLFIHWLFFALIGVAAVIAVYEFCVVYLNKKVALLASFLLAISPMAVAHSRMAYHVTPIPLMMVLFLVAVIHLAHKKKGGLFWATLTWAGLFQFELAVAPLLLIIAYLAYKQRTTLNKKSLHQFLQGLLLGLAPQIIFDLTHRFAHLGGFALWVVYRVVSLAPTGKHQFSVTTVINVSQTFFKYWGRIFSVQPGVVTLLFLFILLATGIVCWRQFRNKKLPLAMEMIILSTLVLTGSYFIHGGPSEAYFPPFLIVLPIIIAYGISQLTGFLWRLSTVLLALFAVFTCVQISSNTFFVGQTNSFGYDYGIGEQRDIVAHIAKQTNQQFVFATTREGGKFANYFDNLRVIAWEQNLTEQPETGHTVFIEGKESPLRSYPNMKKSIFPSVDLYQLL